MKETDAEFMRRMRNVTVQDLRKPDADKCDFTTTGIVVNGMSHKDLVRLMTKWSVLAQVRWEELNK